MTVVIPAASAPPQSPMGYQPQIPVGYPQAYAPMSFVPHSNALHPYPYPLDFILFLFLFLYFITVLSNDFTNPLCTILVALCFYFFNRYKIYATYGLAASITISRWHGHCDACDLYSGNVNLPPICRLYHSNLHLGAQRTLYTTIKETRYEPFNKFPFLHSWF
jgi:hypothetical protein